LNNVAKVQIAMDECSRVLIIRSRAFIKPFVHPALHARFLKASIHVANTRFKPCAIEVF
jgi:hypothetical protein